MSYSLKQVLSCLYENVSNSYYLTSAITNDADIEVLEEELYHLMSSEYETETTLTIPNFTGKNDFDKEETFSAKTFSLTVKKVQKELKDSYEGKTYCSYHKKVIDNDTNEEFQLDIHFYSALDTEITGFMINKVK